MGLATSAVGAAVPLVAWLALRSARFPGTIRLPLFRLAWGMAGALCLLNAGLVLASMPLARRVSIAVQTGIVSTVVALAFVSAGILVLRIASQVSAVGRLQPPETTAPTLAHSMRGLLTSLIIAGTVLDAILGLVAVGLLARIGAGFSIFG